MLRKVVGLPKTCARNLNEKFDASSSQFLPRQQLAGQSRCTVRVTCRTVSVMDILNCLQEICSRKKTCARSTSMHASFLYMTTCASFCYKSFLSVCCWRKFVQSVVADWLQMPVSVCWLQRCLLSSTTVNLAEMTWRSSPQPTTSVSVVSHRWAARWSAAAAHAVDFCPQPDIDTARMPVDFCQLQQFGLWYCDACEMSDVRSVGTSGVDSCPLYAMDENIWLVIDSLTLTLGSYDRGLQVLSVLGW